MTAVAALRNQGFDIAAKDGRLIVQPASRITDDVREFIRAHKAAILAKLEADPITETARRHGLMPERLRAKLHNEDVQAIQRNDDGERLWLEMFADIMAKGIIQEREEALRETFTERAAILEFDANLPRDQAEQEAARVVYCRACAHFTADSLNPNMGLGACSARRAGSLPLPWPENHCWRGEPKEVSP